MHIFFGSLPMYKNFYIWTKKILWNWNNSWYFIGYCRTNSLFTMSPTLMIANNLFSMPSSRSLVIALPSRLQWGFLSSFLVIRPSSNQAPWMPSRGRLGPIRIEVSTSKKKRFILFTWPHHLYFISIFFKNIL